MTGWVINRFAQVTLPVFRPDWSDLCSRCVYKRESVRRTRHTPMVLRCEAIAPARGGFVACSEARAGACRNGEFFKERVL